MRPEKLRGIRGSVQGMRGLILGLQWPGIASTLRPGRVNWRPVVKKS